mgnify:FL=1
MAELASFGQLLLKASDEVSHPLHLMAMRHKKHIGYGLGIVHQYRFGHSTLEHDGCSSGFLCRLIVVPEKEMVITIATNGGGETAATKDFRLITDNILITALSLEKFD